MLNQGGVSRAMRICAQEDRYKAYVAEAEHTKNSQDRRRCDAHRIAQSEIA